MINYSHDKYIDLIENNDVDGKNPEEEYKSAFIPNVLYKYGSFESKYATGNLERICEGFIWMPAIMSLNDPFEFEMITDTLPEEKKIEYRRDTLARNCVLSLSSLSKSNLLWSHYGSAHKGYCLEFEVCDIGCIFPVTYCKEQADGTEEIMQWLTIKKDVLSRVPYKLSNYEKALMAKLQKVMLYKIDDWKYEREFRIIGRGHIDEDMSDTWKIDMGYWQCLRDIGLRLKRIIMGFNSTLENRALIMKMVNEANDRIIMTEMSRCDYKYSTKAVKKTLADMGDLIKVARVQRKGQTLSLRIKNYKDIDGVYDL